MKKGLIIFVTLFTLPIAVFAQEQLSITTYYPSPYGSYTELQLSPIATISRSACTASTNEGKTYYDLTTHEIMVCDYQALGSYAWRRIDKGLTPIGYDAATYPGPTTLTPTAVNLTDIQTSVTVQSGDLVVVMLAGAVKANTANETAYLKAAWTSGSASELLQPNWITSTSPSAGSWGSGSSIGVYKATADGILTFMGYGGKIGRAHV